MTSLQLFSQTGPNQKEPDEWGTGKKKGETDIWLPRGPTWHQRSIPVKQFYDLTSLKRSNVRDNDQLLPEPEECHMGSMLINKSFPAEHPYNSHISKFAVFPNFTSSEDPIKGVAAQHKDVVHAEAPANSYDVQVLHKTKGAGLRHEILKLPADSQKKPLCWNGENHFDQVVKTHGNRQNFYPTPPKSVASNHLIRPIEHQVSERTSDTMKNVESSHWLTSNQLDYSGLGPSNPIKLDNLDDKKAHFLTSGETDTNLYPNFANTFDPARPVEGRIARINLSEPKHPYESNDSQNGSVQRKRTLCEKEEHRLWNGSVYVNMPDISKDPGTDTRWQEIDRTSKSELMVERLKQACEGQRQDNVPFPPTGSPPQPEDGYLSITKVAKDERQQEIEAQNRWKVLESQTPQHDITSLNYKYSHLHDNELPSLFYNHEGKYNEERVGMYKTTYDPHKLTYSMNKDELTGPVITDTTRSHEDALYLPTSLSYDNSVLLRRSQTFCGNTQNLSRDIQTPLQVFAPYQERRMQQKAQLQPTPQTARSLVQEGEFVLKKSNMGDSFNTHKFLQDNELLPCSRKEPLHLMSSENQNIRMIPTRSRSIPKTAKSVQFSDKVTVKHLDSSNTPFQIKSTPLQGLTDDEKTALTQLNFYDVNTTQYSSSQAEWKKSNEDLNKSTLMCSDASSNNNGYTPSFVANSFSSKPDQPISRKSRTTVNVNCDDENAGALGKGYNKEQVAVYRHQPSAVGSEYRNEFDGISAKAVPTGLKRFNSFRSSYHSQFPIYHDMTFKSDPRFEWAPGSGIPRPQTCLLALQDSFSKTDIKNNFNQEFPEKHPEIRDHIIHGKRHIFNGVHGQLMHG